MSSGRGEGREKRGKDMLRVTVNTVTTGNKDKAVVTAAAKEEIISMTKTKEIKAKEMMKAVTTKNSKRKIFSGCGGWG